MLFLLTWLTLVLLDLELEYPLFHVQDEAMSPENPTSRKHHYYLCYRYPRPNYWVDRILKAAGLR
jgi:hypothetical protein